MLCYHYVPVDHHCDDDNDGGGWVILERGWTQTHTHIYINNMVAYHRKKNLSRKLNLVSQCVCVFFFVT
mgnify:CR=1 FL=1